MSREWLMYLNDMIHCAELALSFVEGVDESRFTPDRMEYEATLRQIELMGEAAGHIPVEVQAVAIEIPWREMIGLRNRLAHAYFAVETEVLWNLVQVDLPPTLAALQRLKENPMENLMENLIRTNGKPVQ